MADDSETGPWQDYQAPEEAGPWQEYAPSAVAVAPPAFPKLSPAELGMAQAGIPAFEPPKTLGQAVMGGLQSSPLALVPPVRAEEPATTGVLTGLQPFTGLPPEVMAAAVNEAKGFGEFATSPLGKLAIPAMVASPIIRRGLSLLFGGQLALGAKDRIAQAKTSQDVIEGLIEGAMAPVVAAGALPRRTVTQTTPTVPKSEIPATPSATGILPAVRKVGGETVVGEAGQTHPEIMAENKIPREEVDQRVFVDQATGQVLDREQAAAATPEVSTATEPGRRHSTDLPEAQAQAEVVAKQDWPRIYRDEHDTILEAQGRMEEAIANGDRTAESEARRERNDALSRLDEFDQLSRGKETSDNPTVEALRNNPRLTLSDAVTEGQRLVQQRREDAAYDAVLDAGGTVEEAKAATANLQKAPPAAPTGGAPPRDWDLFYENLTGELDAYNPARESGKINYGLEDVASRFVDYAKADKEGRTIDQLVSDFSQEDMASAGQLRKLSQSVSRLMEKEGQQKPPVPVTQGEEIVTPKPVPPIELVEDATDFIKGALASKRPPKTADEALAQYKRNTAVGRSRGEQFVDDDEFKSLWNTFVWNTFVSRKAPPTAQPVGAPPAAPAAVEAKAPVVAGAEPAISEATTVPREKQGLSERIVKEVGDQERRRHTIVERFPIIGSDGKTYYGDLPFGVKMVGRGDPYYAFQTREGTIVGKRYDTRQEAEAANEAFAKGHETEMRKALSEMTPEQIQSQAQYWLKEPVHPVSESKRAEPSKSRPAKKPKQLLTADRISDFRPGLDRVVRRGDEAFVVDSQGERADVRVASDKITPELADRIRKLPKDKLAMARRTTEETPYLSPEGKAERLAVFDEVMGRNPTPAAPEPAIPIDKPSLPQTQAAPDVMAGLSAQRPKSKSGGIRWDIQHGRTAGLKAKELYRQVGSNEAIIEINGQRFLIDNISRLKELGIETDYTTRKATPSSVKTLGDWNAYAAKYPKLGPEDFGARGVEKVPGEGVTRLKPTPAAPVTEGKAVEKPPYQVSFDSLAGGRETVTVSRVKFDQLPDQMKKLVENEMYHASQFEEWNNYGKWEKVKQGKTSITLWEKRAGDEVTHNISLDSPETEFKNWATREDLYQKEYNPAGRALRDKLISEREAADKAAADKKAAEEAETQRLIGEFREYETEIAKVKLPTGKKTTITVQNVKGEKSDISGTAYGPWLIDKRVGGKGKYADPTVYKVSHIPSGLGISGDGLTSLEQAKNYVRALIDSGVRTDWKVAADLTKEEHAKITEVAKAWIAGGEVPSYFKAKAEPKSAAPPETTPALETKLTEAEKVQKYAREMVVSAANYINRSIESGSSAKDASLQWAKEIGQGLMDVPDDVYRKERGGLYTSTYVKGVFGTKDGVAVNAKDYLRAIDAARANAIRRWKKPTEPPETGPTIGPGPGARTAGTDFPPGAQIEQLSQAFRRISAEKTPLLQKIKEAFDFGRKRELTQNLIARTLSALKTSGDYLIDTWKGQLALDPILKAKGELSAELETRGWRLRQAMKDMKRAVPSKAVREAISKYVDAGGDLEKLRQSSETVPAARRAAYLRAMQLTPEEKLVAGHIQSYFEARMEEAIDAGVFSSGVENYIHRIYPKDTQWRRGVINSLQNALLDTRTPGLAKKRFYELDADAERAGQFPIGDFIPRVLDYEASLAKVIASRAAVKKFTEIKMPDGRPMLDVSGMGVPIENAEGIREATLIKPSFRPGEAQFDESGKPTKNYRKDYQSRDYPALKRWRWATNDPQGNPIFVQGDVLVHPDAVHRIDALLEPSKVRKYAAARAALTVGSVFKQTMLDFSGFHQVQISIHGLEHKVNPFNLVKDVDTSHPDIQGLLRGGMTLGGHQVSGLYQEGLVGRSLSRQIPGLGELMESYHEWLFQDFIPRVKTTMAIHALARNRTRFAKDLASGRMTEDALYHQTAKEANAAFGEQNYIMLERSKTAQDMARLVLLAPDFLEARARFALQAATRLGGEQRMALLLGALTLYTTARLMNKALNDEWHFEPENLFSVIHNGKAYSTRTVQGDILHAVEEPVRFWLHRLNPTITRPLFELVTGRDEFGRRRSFWQVMGDTISNAVPISMRFGREQSIWTSMLNAFGGSARRDSDISRVYREAAKWKEKNGIRTEPGEFIYDPSRDIYRPLKLALLDGNREAAAAEYQKLIASKTVTPAQALKHFQTYAHAPFSGSIKNERKFAASLTQDQRHAYEGASQEKLRIFKDFLKARSLVPAAAPSGPWTDYQ